MGRDFWVEVAIICSLLVFALSGAWRYFPNWLGGHRPNIRLRELSDILVDEDKIETNYSPMKSIPGAQVRIQFFDDKSSVMYHRTQNRKSVTETVNVSAPPKGGVIVTLVDNRVSVLEKIGGLTSKNPEIDAEDREGLAILLGRVRKLAGV